MSTTDDIGTLYVLAETERAALAVAMAKDRARRMRWHAAGNVLLACLFLIFVIAVAVVTKGRAGSPRHGHRQAGIVSAAATLKSELSAVRCQPPPPGWRNLPAPKGCLS
jgi:hypothetical protein